MQRPDPGQRGSVAANRNRCGPSRRRVGVGLSASRPPIRRCSMLLPQCPGQEDAWRSARADQEPCKPLREVRATFFPVLDDVTNDGREGCGDGHDPMANVTLNIVGPSWYDQSKIFLPRSARTAGRVKHIHVTYGRPVVGAGEEMQKATLWQAPNNSIMARLSTGP